MSGTATVARLSLWTAVLLVIANMIGTGVFTMTGFMAGIAPAEGPILLTWLLVGVLALCGALSYGELAAAMPRSGGEYNYLSQLYHPALGFISGFISLIVGFSAPIAGAALIFGAYMGLLSGAETALFSFSGGTGKDAWTWAFGSGQLIAIGLALALTLLHLFSVKGGARVQNAFTVLKVLLVLVFIFAGLAAGDRSVDITGPAGTWEVLGTAGFGTMLALAYFAYSGWNAATYISGEIQNPRRNVPLALALGTVIVSVLYVALNYVFLKIGAPAEIAGQEDFAGYLALQLFGNEVGFLMAAFIAVALISSASSMTMAGPRVTCAIGEDFPLFARLGSKRADGAPAPALWLQFAVTVGFIVYGDAQTIFNYIGLTLSLFAALAVAGVFILRARHGSPMGYKIPLFPLPPVLFLALVGWLIVWSVVDFGTGTFKTVVPLYSLATLAVGFLIYLLAGRSRTSS